MPISKTMRLGLLAWLAMGASMGCGKSPTSPSGGAPPPEAASYINPTFVRVENDNSGPSIPEMMETEVDGAAGDTLVMGRFTLQIPDGAFNGVSKVSMRVADPDYMKIELEIEHPAADNFLKPVCLFADCSGAYDANMDDVAPVRFDEVDGVWRTVSCQVDQSAETVTVPLSHFSRYGLIDRARSRAGW